MRYLVLLFCLLSTPAIAVNAVHIDVLERQLLDALLERDSDRAQKLRNAIAERSDWAVDNNIDPREDYIVVNVSAQRVRLVQRGQVAFDEKVIVGRPGMETPTFTDEIVDIVVNPVWNIPPDLAADMLPKMKEVGGWNGYKVYVDGEIVDDVSQVEEGMNYRIVQDASETNALGNIKFNLPNKYGVYLHDTPQRHLFDEDNRQFSAGCVRVQNADVLMSKLLDWDVDAVQSSIDELTTYSIPLPSPVKVYIVDWAAHIDENGTVILN